VTKQLLAWFKKQQRDLPWRKKRSPYKVWISEIMLQQTQVVTVIPYFKRWLKQFPTVKVLAFAPLDKVLKQWEGLGYYRRARMLHQSASILSKQGFPRSYQEWLELPGVGPYTAAAISSIVNSEAVIAVDGNVKRVVSRLFMLPVVTETTAKEHLAPFISKKYPGDFNEAMMELGATICTPRNPNCSKCPVKTHCRAYLHSRVDEYPAKKLKVAIPHYTQYAEVYQHKNKLHLKQRGENEMLSGLWGFTLVDKKPKGKSLPQVSHTYSHFRLTVTPVIVTEKPVLGKLVSKERLESLALSTLDYKILDVLRQQNLLT
jgi:A/G-specific adenine glycosylase